MCDIPPSLEGGATPSAVAPVSGKVCLDRPLFSNISTLNPAASVFVPQRLETSLIGSKVFTPPPPGLDRDFARFKQAYRSGDGSSNSRRFRFSRSIHKRGPKAFDRLDSGTVNRASRVHLEDRQQQSHVEEFPALLQVSRVRPKKILADPRQDALADLQRRFDLLSTDQLHLRVQRLPPVCEPVDEPRHAVVPISDELLESSPRSQMLEQIVVASNPGYLLSAPLPTFGVDLLAALATESLVPLVHHYHAQGPEVMIKWNAPHHARLRPNLFGVLPGQSAGNNHTAQLSECLSYELLFALVPELELLFVEMDIKYQAPVSKMDYCCSVGSFRVGVQVTRAVNHHGAFSVDDARKLLKKNSGVSNHLH